MKFKKARLKRFPRAVYWVAGATLACTGAVGARLFSESFPLQERVGIWLAGAGVVFLGLCVLSLGTRRFLEADLPDEEEGETVRPPAPDAGRKGGDQPPDHTSGGAGEGNRTLA